MTTLNDKQRKFLEHPFVGTLTTLRDDGSPHSTIVWVDTETDEVLFNTATGRAKERHLRKDPRVSSSDADLQAQFALARQINDRVSAANEAVIRIRAIKDQISARLAKPM